MSTITKQAVQAVADLKAGYTLGHADVAILNELARIALASLEADPVHQVYGNNDDTWSDVDEEEMIRLRSDGEDTRTLYTAPPAPVSVLDITALDNLAGEMLNHAMNCERRVAVAYTHCAHSLAEEVRDLRAAMLQGAERVTTAYKLPPHIYRELVNRLRDTAVKYQGCQQLREQLSRTLQEVIQPAVPQQEVK